METAQPTFRAAGQDCTLSRRARNPATAAGCTSPAPTKMDTTLLSAASSASPVAAWGASAERDSTGLGAPSNTVTTQSSQP